MEGFVKKYGKFIAVIIAVSILISGIPIYFNYFKLKQVQANENENRVATEISNMTGVKFEDVMQLRGYGLSWNDVLTRVKSSAYKKDNTDRRDNVLANTSLGEDYVEKLVKEGYDREKITDVKLQVERVTYDLKEITSELDTSTIAPKADVSQQEDKEEEITEVCSKINEKFDLQNAVYLCVKLEKEFGSIDKVLDEYLLCIQVELNLEEYLIDKKEYEKQKGEKTALYTKTIVNMEKIEDLLLKKIQSNQKDKAANAATDSTDAVNTLKGNLDKNTSPLPDSSIPEMKDVKPQNPANEIMKEIQNIDPMKNGGK